MSCVYVQGGARHDEGYENVNLSAPSSHAVRSCRGPEPGTAVGRFHFARIPGPRQAL